MDKRGMNDKRNIRGHINLVNQKCRGPNFGRETSPAVPKRRSSASLQHGSIGHVNDTLLEELDLGWFKICKGKVVRQNLNPFFEAQKALGIGKPPSMLLRPPAGDSVTKACNRPFRKPGDGI
jgi:hypothetical protein